MKESFSKNVTFELCLGGELQQEARERKQKKSEGERYFWQRKGRNLKPKIACFIQGLEIAAYVERLEGQEDEENCRRS